jgi:hypothetical protein
MGGRTEYAACGCQAADNLRVLWQSAPAQRRKESQLRSHQGELLGISVSILLGLVLEMGNLLGPIVHSAS